MNYWSLDPSWSQMCVHLCSQVLLCFSRDTTVLDHFKYNSATPPKSYIQGEMMCPS